MVDQTKLSSKKYSWVLAPFILALGLVLMGFFISGLGHSFNQDNRHILVKGLAEQEVQADLAIWKISFNTSGNDLSTIAKQSTKTQEALTSFLKKENFTDEEISNGDFWVNNNITENKKVSITYTGSIVVRTSDISKIQKANKNIYALIKNGFLISSENLRYIFNKINDIKPKLLTTALDNAQKTANIIAQSSHSQIGKIRYANQGTISIVARDIQTNDSWTEQQSPYKIIRMVVTVDYNLL